MSNRLGNILNALIILSVGIYLGVPGGVFDITKLGPASFLSGMIVLIAIAGVFVNFYARILAVAIMILMSVATVLAIVIWVYGGIPVGFYGIPVSRFFSFAAVLIFGGIFMFERVHLKKLGLASRGMH